MKTVDAEVLDRWNDDGRGYAFARRAGDGLAPKTMFEVGSELLLCASSRDQYAVVLRRLNHWNEQLGEAPEPGKAGLWEKPVADIVGLERALEGRIALPRAR